MIGNVRSSHLADIRLNQLMSAFWGKADIALTCCNVR
jgi:hypothetical protein